MHVADGVAAGLPGGEPDDGQVAQDVGDLLELHEVELDVLAGGDVAPAPGVRRRRCGRACVELVGGQAAVGDLHPHHLVVAALALAVDAVVQAEDPEDVLLEVAGEVAGELRLELGDVGELGGVDLSLSAWRGPRNPDRMRSGFTVPETRPARSRFPRVQSVTGAASCIRLIVPGHRGTVGGEEVAAWRDPELLARSCERSDHRGGCGTGGRRRSPRRGARRRGALRGAAAWPDGALVDVVPSGQAPWASTRPGSAEVGQVQGARAPRTGKVRSGVVAGGPPSGPAGATAITKTKGSGAVRRPGTAPPARPGRCCPSRPLPRGRSPSGRGGCCRRSWRRCRGAGCR